MAKKQNVVNEVTETEVPEEECTPMEDNGFQFDSDFDVDEEYKVAPLIPSGTYEGFISSVSFDPSDQTLNWTVTIHADNDVFMSDNETPVNGCTMVYKNYFPKAGDEDVRTKTGKMTKRQAKINMISDFQKKMGIDMNTPKKIVDGVSNSEWIGLEVVAVVEVREYQGRLSNQIKEIKAA